MRNPLIGHPESSAGKLSLNEVDPIPARAFIEHFEVLQGF